MRIFTANSAASIPALARTNGNCAGREPNGFSLIEILVVMFLIGLASAAVLLSLPGDTSKIRDQADRLAARIAAARDSAVMGSQPVAVWLRSSGYGFERRRGGIWQAAAGQSFAQHNWPAGTTSKFGAQTEPRIIFDVTGLPSAPLHIDLQRGEAQVAVIISAAGDVSIAK